MMFSKTLTRVCNSIDIDEDFMGFLNTRVLSDASHLGSIGRRFRLLVAYRAHLNTTEN